MNRGYSKKKKMEIIINHPQKADIFVTLFQNIRPFTEYINLFFESERLFVQSMDSGHVSIMEIALPKRWFDKYESTAPSTTIIGLNVGILSKILATREKSQTIRIVYNPEENEDKLFIHFVSENRAIFDKHFEVPLIEIDMELMRIPPMEYQAEFSISAASFANIVNQLKLFGDTMDIHCSEDKIVLYSNSAESGKMFVEINMDDLTEFAIEEGEQMEVSFSLTYLHKICMYHKLVKEIGVNMSVDAPMKIVFALEDSAPSQEVSEESIEKAQLTFYLAPKANIE